MVSSRYPDSKMMISDHWGLGTPTETMSPKYVNPNLLEKQKCRHASRARSIKLVPEKLPGPNQAKHRSRFLGGRSSALRSLDLFCSFQELGR